MPAALTDAILRLIIEGRASPSVRNAFGQVKKEATEAERALDAATRKQAQYGRAATVSAAGATTLAAALGVVLHQAGAVEQIEIGLKTNLGSLDAARAKMKELEKFADASPFNFQQSALAANQMLAMGIAADDLIPTMTALGDAVSAAGGGQEVFSGALMAIGQIKSAGKVSAEELRQLAERGIPAFQILQDELGLTGEQVANIGEHGISSARGIAALTAGMNKRFGGAMAEQAKTVNGRLSTLQDASRKLAGALGKSLSPAFNGVVAGATQLVNALNAASAPMKAFTAWAGVTAVGALTAFAAWCKWNESVAMPRYIKRLAELATAHGAAAGAAGIHTAAEAALGTTVATAGAAKGRAGAGIIVPAAGAAAGTAAKAGKFALPAAGIAAAVAAEIGLAFLPDAGGVGVGKRAAQGAAAGAGLGMALGSIVPGLGTAVGAAGGAVIGGGAAFAGDLGTWAGQRAAPGLTTADERRKMGVGAKVMTDAEQRMIALMEEQNRLLGDIKQNKLPMSTDLVPGAEQARAIRGAMRLA